MTSNLHRRLAAEAIGTAFLLATVVGSGIMGERLAAGNVAITLLANSIATGAALTALILTFGPISGAHFNPSVTISCLAQRELTWKNAVGYFVAQIGGACAGVAAANLMFDDPPFFVSHHARNGGTQLFSEFVATLGLLLVIGLCARLQPQFVAFAVGTYITAAYWFTASTSFANPAVTLARELTDTFAGIRPVDVPAFVLVQLLGTAAATLVLRWLIPKSPLRSSDA